MFKDIGDCSLQINRWSSLSDGQIDSIGISSVPSDGQLPTRPGVYRLNESALPTIDFRCQPSLRLSIRGLPRFEGAYSGMLDSSRLKSISFGVASHTSSVSESRQIISPAWNIPPAQISGQEPRSTALQFMNPCAISPPACFNFSAVKPCSPLPPRRDPHIEPLPTIDP